MQISRFSLLALILALGTALAQQLPDAKLTPGATNPKINSAETLCAAGFHTAPFRHVTEATKRQVYANYHRAHKAGVCCEVDHLISLELGGSNDIANLWPQPYTPRPGAYEKDQLENYLHDQVCSGRMTLSEAQRAVAHDWWKAYQDAGLGK